jgi:hypothetical protein
MTFQDLFNEQFYPHDIPHLGALCKQIRVARGLSGQQVAKWCRCKSSATITRDFEIHNQLGKEYFQRWKELFQDPQRVPMTLSSTQANILQMLYEGRDEDTQKVRHREVSKLNFKRIHPDNAASHPALGDLVDKLARTPHPAFIMDDLWFIHAQNEAQLQLYNIEPSSPFLHRWEGWHVIAGKIPTDSPVRIAYDEVGQFVPPSIVYFFQHEYTQRYLFTLPVRQLLYQLFTLSTEHDYEIHKWWSQLLSFTLPYNTISIPRSVTVNGVTLYTNPSIADAVTVELDTGEQVNYILVVWEMIAASNPAFEQLTANTPQRVFYAADYDRRCTFHVTTWPEVQPHLKRLSR